MLTDVYNPDVRPEIPQVAVVITTFNRCEDVCRAIDTCFAQEDVDLEVLVYDNSTNRETDDAIRRLYPQVRLFAGSSHLGYIPNRNRGFQDANAPLVISLDDDAYFTSTDTARRVVEAFQAEPSLGALALPYIEPRNRRSKSSLDSPFRSAAGDELRNYIGCAHAVRREAVLAENGYREFYVHQHEERDLCLRMRSSGWRIAYGDGAPIVHMVSPSRDTFRIWYFAGRNQMLGEFLNAPFPDVLLRIPATIAGFLRYRFSFRLLPLKLRALGAGVLACLRHARKRAPVSRAVYRRHRQLPTHGPLPWEGEIPAPCARGDVT